MLENVLNLYKGTSIQAVTKESSSYNSTNPDMNSKTSNSDQTAELSYSLCNWDCDCSDFGFD